MTEPRRFHLQRAIDITGASGTGRVADGIQWPDGTVSIRWRGERPSVVFWGSIDDAEQVHGRGGASRIIWDDDNPDQPTWALRCSCGGQGVTHLSAEHHEPIGPADTDPFAGRACPLCGDYVTGPCPECATGAVANMARLLDACDRADEEAIQRRGSGAEPSWTKIVRALTTDFAPEVQP